ncbi:hypothetical protein N7510_008794 [Penicillium lagena]|uniref:uncharacterized protein n=1 Tax=Penicillium lagena TaxID=94218 RepID=UPI00253F860F|nr:uncharacterized protein N7510_008794 [Penicillium lagena]KAJ5606013.1 hypothetical protein N7510_008794 [Penicillium lagena]
MAPFKVLIVGGSVSGLSLANMLEQHAIDYELLESSPIIGPDLGFVLAMQPNGMRILDQLGCYDAVMERAVEVESLRGCGPTGNVLLDLENHGNDQMARLGYRLTSIARSDLIRSLYGNLNDKSKIYPNKRVTRVEPTESGVSVLTEDGSVWTGSIVVGADGVRSMVRREMWRIAQEQKSDLLGEEDGKSISSTYSCVFGVSPDIRRVRQNTFYITVNSGRSYLVAPGLNGTSYWVLFVPNDKPIPGPDGRRYTVEDEQKLVKTYFNDQVAEGVTLGDFYKRKTRSIMLTLEEGVLKQWFGGRIVLLGDTAHKMHPVAGVGGSHAIESAVALTNILAETLQEEPSPSDASISEAFQQFQNGRRDRAEESYNEARQMQQMHILENRVLRFIQLVVSPRLSAEFIMDQVASHFSPAPRLKALPVPMRQKRWGYDDEVRLKPLQRAPGQTLLFIFLLACAMIVSWIVSPLDTVSNTSSVGPLLHEDTQVRSRVLRLALTVVWTIESYRVGAVMTPLISAILWTVMAHLFGYEVIGALYMSVYAFISQKRSFYYPIPRAISILTARACFWTLVLAAIIPPTVLLSRLLDGKISLGDTAYVWETALLCYPAMVFGVSKLAPPSSSQPEDSTEKTRTDIEYISWTLLLLAFLSGAVSLFHALAIIRGDSITPSDIFGLFTPHDPLAPCIFIWCAFTIWDLQRVQAPGIRMLKNYLFLLVIGAVLGSSAVLPLTWLLREYALERGRKRRELL